MTRADQKRELKKQGERLKKLLPQIVAQLSTSERLRFKIALMEGGAGESTARHLMNGEYRSGPGKDLIENMEDVVAKFRKAEAS